jgi:hypothetical protein
MTLYRIDARWAESRQLCSSKSSYMIVFGVGLWFGELWVDEQEAV